MKIIGVNGSPRAEGNTYHVIGAFFEELHKGGIETELLHVGNNTMQGCVACSGCVATGECAFHDELFREYTEKLVAADGVLLAAPAYFGTMPGQTKSFLDRFFYQCVQTGRMRLKVGGSLSIVRRAGGNTTLDDLNRYFISAEMIIATSAGQAVIHGHEPGEVLQDSEGLGNARRLARNMTWLLKMKEATKEELALPPYEKKKYLNFIR